MNIFQQAAALVSDPPGSLVYYLVLLFAMGAAAAVALGQWRATAAPAGQRDASRGRLALAAGLLFLLRLLALVFAILAAIGLLDPLVAIAPIERAISTLTIVVVFWFLLFPKPNPPGDAAFGLLAILVVLGLAISWGLWYQQARLLHFYNGSPQETVWEAAQLFLLVAGGILLIVRRPADWLLGLVIAGLLLAAHLVHYLYPIAQSNVSGTERLFEIIVLPLIAAAVLRQALQPAAGGPPAPSAPVALAEGDTQPIQAMARPITTPQPGLDSRAAVAFASLGTSPDLTALAQSVTVGVAHALPAPISLFLTPADGGYKVECVYQSQASRFSGLLLPVLADRPEIRAALQADETILWGLGETEAELRTVAFEAGLEPDGPVLLMPVRLPGGPLLGALGALPAAGQAGWQEQQHALLKSLALPVAQACQAVATRGLPSAEVTSLNAERDAANGEANQLRLAAQAQTEQIQRLERAAASHADELVELEALRAHLQALGPDIDLSRQHQQELETALEQQRRQADEARAELERLKAQPTAVEEKSGLAPDAERSAANVAAEPSEAEALRTTLGMLQPQLDYYRQQEQQLLAQLEEVRAELTARPAPQPAPAANPEAEILRANLQALAEEIDAYRAEQSRLETALELSRQGAALHQSALVESEQQSAKLQAELDQVRAAALTQPAPATASDDHVLRIQNLEARLEAAGARAQQLAGELAQSMNLSAQLQSQLLESQQSRQQAVDELAAHEAQVANAGAPPKPANGFMDPDQGMAEMLEVLASAESRLSQQARQIGELQQALAESEQQRRAPAPQVVARPVQAADMEVIASLAQELRQPMSSIIGYVELLLSESVGIIGALQRKFLERIKASSERTGVLLDDLMRVMAIDSGNLKLEQESVNVPQVIKAALHGCQSQFDEKGLRLVTDMPPNLPPVQADRDALLQIFSHLINNSGAASASDSEVHLSVRHESEARPGADALNYLIISVTDTGGGIAPEDQPRVFSRLYRADAPLIGGLGDNCMGLSIVKALVEGLGGRIWVISDPGAGSTFYVLLPLEGKYAKANGLRH
jgi:signal transduction histidine kinase